MERSRGKQMDFGVARINIRNILAGKDATGLGIRLLLPGLLLSAAVTNSQAGNNAREVMDAQDNSLGIYGGIGIVRDAEGAQVSALLTLTDTDYLVPLTTQGELGLFSSAYFSEPGCAGLEYLSPITTDSGLAPTGGVVYQSLNSGNARYVPRFAAADTFITGSRLSFDGSNGRVCEEVKASLPLLQTYANDPGITGFDMGRDTGRTLAISKPLPPQKGGLFSPAADDSYVEEPLPLEQQECSPGCTMGDIGNNYCDIACYVNACSFDGGDCDNETPEFLQEEQAKYCSAGCTFEDIGDGFCDTNCNNNACDFDGGDCDEVQ